MLTDGADRSGLEGIPALGKSHCSATMRHLNLHRCKKLSTLSMKAIAKLSSLETLDLSGCNELTLEGGKVHRKNLHMYIYTVLVRRLHQQFNGGSTGCST